MASLERADDRVTGRLEMEERMSMRRVLAAADMSARQADAQGNPLLAECHALLAPLGSRRRIADQLEMLTAVVGLDCIQFRLHGRWIPGMATPGPGAIISVGTRG